MNLNNFKKGLAKLNIFKTRELTKSIHEAEMFLNLLFELMEIKYFGHDKTNYILLVTKQFQREAH